MKAKGEKKAKGVKNLPFQLAEGKRWFKDSRAYGKMTIKTKKGK